MSKNLLATLALTTVELRAGQSFGHHAITLSRDGIGIASVGVMGDSVTFSGLEPGTYVASGISVGDDGRPLTAEVFSAPFTVTADPLLTTQGLASITLSLI